MASSVVALANVKGGVGKSTCAVHLAEWMRHRGKQVILVDSDKQGSAAAWAVWRMTEAEKPAPQITRLYEKELLVQIPSLRERYERIVIDTRGSDGTGTRAALVVAQVVVVPVRDSDFDAAALDDLMALIGEARAINPDLRAFAYLSQIDSRRAFPAELLAYMEEVGLVPLKTVIRHRAAFSKAGRGLSVFEIGDQKASEEMDALCQEIENELAKTKK